MSDNEQPRKDADEKGKDIEQVQIGENNIKSEEHKSENEEIKVEMNKNEEVAIKIDETTDNGDAVRRKPVLAIYFFGQKQPQGGGGGGFPWSSEPPPPVQSRGPPLNYKSDSRNDFVRLVLFLVLTMLIATAGFISMALINDSLNEFFATAPMMLLFLPALVCIMTATYAFMCSPCANKPPCNFVMLFIATVGMTLIATKISVHYGTEVVLYAVMATSGIVFGCICLACTNFDFTRYMLYVVVISMAFSVIFLIVILVKMFTGVWMKPVIIIMLSIATLIQAVLLVMELQTVLGGGAIELSEDDYAYGAFSIYTSIVDIFIKMVQIIGLATD